MQVQFLSRTPKKELSFDAPFGIGGFFFLRVDAKAVDSERRYSTPPHEKAVHMGGRAISDGRGKRGIQSGPPLVFWSRTATHSPICSLYSPKHIWLIESNLIIRLCPGWRGLASERARSCSGHFPWRRSSWQSRSPLFLINPSLPEPV